MRSHQPRLLRELHDAVRRLGDALSDHPPIAAALQRFADRLPDLPDYKPTRSEGPIDPARLKPLLWQALAEGWVEAAEFDAAMIIQARVIRMLEGCL